ncbi:MAG: NAD-dependent deacylase [Bacteroidota bacterium]
MDKARIVVLTGAGISAESGLSTFRGNGGLWEGHDIQEVASPQGFKKNPEMVLRFYNERRQQAKSAQPNAGHKALVELEEKYEVWIITQNVDDLHEKAGSSNILHLHGELNKARSATDENYVIEIQDDINIGDLGPNGGQMRPHIVWFGEDVPKINDAIEIMTTASLVIIVGTSLVVYPAAGLVHYAPMETPICVVDPNKPELSSEREVFFIEEPATRGLPTLVQRLLKEV